MLTQTKAAPVRLVFQSQAVPAAVLAVVLALVVALAAVGTDWGAVPERLATATEALAGLVFRDYILPFEVVGVLLLAAVVGAVVLARREEGAEG